MDEEGRDGQFPRRRPLSESEQDVEVITEWNWPFIAGAGVVLAIVLGAAAFLVLRDGAGDEAAPATTASTTTTQPVPLSKDFTVAALLPLDGQYAQMLGLVESAGEMATLEGNEEITLLAPGPEAFAEAGIDPGTTDPELAEQLVRRHILQGAVTMSDLLELDGGTVTTIDGEELSVSVEGTNVTVGSATIAKSNITADNGVIHVVTALVQT